MPDSSFYDAFSVFEDDAKRVGWYDLLDQHLKFECVFEAMGNVRSVVDLGSGLGDLIGYLRGRGYTGDYIGIEIDPKLIEGAREKYPNEHFKNLDFLLAPLPQVEIGVSIGGLVSSKEMSYQLMEKCLGHFKKSVLIGVFETANVTLVLEDDFVGMPDNSWIHRLNMNEGVQLFGVKLHRDPKMRLEDVIKRGDYPLESIARAYYLLGDKESALLLLGKCTTKLGRTMLGVWK